MPHFVGAFFHDDLAAAERRPPTGKRDAGRGLPIAGAKPLYISSDAALRQGEAEAEALWQRAQQLPSIEWLARSKRLAPIVNLGFNLNKVG
jgi:hypothetical protein